MSTEGQDPIAQLREVSEPTWAALTGVVESGPADQLGQALAAALLGDRQLALQVLHNGAHAMASRWPNLTDAQWPPNGGHPYLTAFDESDDEDDEDDRPRTICGCGYDVVWTGAGWQHDAAPWFWGDDHDPQVNGAAQAAAETWDAAEAAFRAENG